MVNIREYKENDEKGILKLFKKVFNVDRDKDYWHWQYMENPSSDPIIILAEEDKEIKGQCTLLPTKLIIGGEEILGGQSIDTMIDKELRGQGMHSKLANKSYEIGVDKNIKVRYGFPSSMALRGLLGSIGGSLVEEIPLYTKYLRFDNILLKIVKIKPLAKLLDLPLRLMTRLIYPAKKIKVNDRYVVKEIEYFDEDVDLLWKKIKDNNKIMTVRDKEYLNWRIKNHPDIRYKSFGAYLDSELAGYIIIKIEKRKIRNNLSINMGSIVDLIGMDEETIEVLYKEALGYFKKENTDMIVTWVTDTMVYRNILIRQGFSKSKSTIPFVVKCLVEDEELEEKILSGNNWYIMPIESDFY